MPVYSDVSRFIAELSKQGSSCSSVSCAIFLAEPHTFISGSNCGSEPVQREDQTGTTILRGKLQIHARKRVKIKAIQLELIGRARTEWPDGIPPLKHRHFEEERLKTQVLIVFNALSQKWQTDYGEQCTYELKTSSARSNVTNLAALPSPGIQTASVTSPGSGVTANEVQHLCLHSVQLGNLSQAHNDVVTTTRTKDSKIFHPGTYHYSFELPIDYHEIESSRLPNSSVRWELHAIIDRAGVFKPNVHCKKDVSIVRLPSCMSLEMTEPIWFGVFQAFCKSFDQAAKQFTSGIEHTFANQFATSFLDFWRQSLSILPPVTAPTYSSVVAGRSPPQAPGGHATHSAPPPPAPQQRANLRLQGRPIPAPPKEGLRVFVRLDAEAPARKLESYAIRTHIAAKAGIDLHQIPAAFPVNSGWVVRTTDSATRDLIVQRQSEWAQDLGANIVEASPKWYTYVVANCPRRLTDLQGNEADYDEAVRGEITCQTGLSAKRTVCGKWENSYLPSEHDRLSRMNKMPNEARERKTHRLPYLSNHSPKMQAWTLAMNRKATPHLNQARHSKTTAGNQSAANPLHNLKVFSLSSARP
ncbi:arrestin domain-containing protein [Purpureocillium lilacinum]|uniref:Arrestin domain-containing protein n=1 Tax=Purpureocillium lilacinum TaxID=33203 RepID=A0A179FJ58_PURLI|nr:arrestin domain-containing protein [Purpureocillium lilacinum]